MAAAANNKPTTPKRKKSSQGAANLDVLRRFVEALGSQAEEEPAADALGRAQDLVYRAYEARTASARLRLARQAIEVSPLCADAFCLLADAEGRGSDAAIELYRKAVSAGEAALGPNGFENFADGFWGYLETRPYMRARKGLALALHARGDVEEAAAHMRGLLELNPNDNQGVRYALLSLLQETRGEDELEALLKRYKEESAAWTYTAALASFRRHGDAKPGIRRLKAALDCNPHVPAFLLGTVKLPRKAPDFIEIGEPNEAIDYVQANRDAWSTEPGALDWLRKHAAPVLRTR